MSRLYQYLMRIIPQRCGGKSILRGYSFLTLRSLNKKEIRTHRENNEKLWERRIGVSEDGYLKHQDALSEYQYGRHYMDYNGCEIMAVYNALKRLQEEPSLSELIAYFEKHGIAGRGKYGTSPKAILRYLTKKEYPVAMCFHSRRHKKPVLTDGWKDCPAYIVVLFNDKDNLEEYIHTMCLIREGEQYRLLNDYEGNRTYESVQEALNGYHDGKSKWICVMQLEDKKRRVL